jgi:hypothetical protein
MGNKLNLFEYIMSNYQIGGQHVPIRIKRLNETEGTIFDVDVETGDIIN